MKRTNFAFRYQWSLAIAHLAAEYRLEIFEATVRYAETGDTGPMSEVAEEAFNSFILPDFERRRKAAAYRARAKARRMSKLSDNTGSSDISDNSDNSENPGHPEPTTTTPAGPNRRERRRLEAEEKRLQKKRRRNAAARAKHEAEVEPAPTTVIPPLPRMYTPFWL